MSKKPFACKHTDCDLSFANEDHLQVHHKCHEMVLNVGLANKNQPFADQTPTPTRFMRNCEEVGLFQDLQNVNPFEETFKKAIDHSISPETQCIPTLNVSDDTLHTPHIFPHIDTEIANKSSSSHDSTDLDVDSPLDQSDKLIIIDDSDDEEVDQIIVDINQSTLTSIAKPDVDEPASDINITSEIKTERQNAITVETNNKMTLKDKLRKRLQIRNESNQVVIKERVISENDEYLPQPKLLYGIKRNILTNTYDDSLVAQKQLRKRGCAVQANESIVSSSTEISSIDGAEPDEDVTCNKDEDRKLRNRVAQYRSRLRKKIHYDVINVQLKGLQSQTNVLKTENKALKKQIQDLKKYILTHHQKCAFTGDMIFLRKCLRPEGVTDKPKPVDISPPISSKKRILLPAPSKTTPILLPSSKNPIILSVPPTRLPPKGNVDYIVVTPPK